MVICNAVGLSKSFGEDVLFDNVTFEIGDKDRIGFVGVNGSGKSTLFKIIMGEMPLDSGSVYFAKNASPGYMAQHVFTQSDRTLYEEMLTASRDVIEIEEQLGKIAQDIDSGVGDVHAMIQKQLAMQEKFEAMGGLTYQSRTRAALLGLGFDERDFNMSCSHLSGGQKSKISLGKLLLSSHNLLLLDEPTNHLDIASVEWLEEFIKGYSGAVIIVSHDRYFLDKVTTRTFELEHRHLLAYKGSYSAYLAKKEEDKAIAEHHYNNAMKEIRRIEGIIVQQRQWNREKNIRTAESKAKMLERLKEELVKPESELERLHFKFSANTVSGSDVLFCEGLAKGFQKPLFHDVSFQIKKGQRIFLLGANGCGKTTLLKMLMNKQTPDAGKIRFGVNVNIGYFEQTQSNLHLEKTLIDEIWDDYPDMTQTEIRSALAAFLFKNEDVFKRISELSGGERARTALLKLMLSGSNLLLLDEPTNHLDITSREALENALQEYDGTLLMVSHDRYFINKLATGILELNENGVNSYIGNYDYYLERRVAEQPSAQPAESKGANEYKERKAKESEKRRLLGKISRLEQEIAELEEQIARLEEKLGSEEIAADYEKLMQASQEHRELKDKLDENYILWEELQAQAENFI